MNIYRSLGRWYVQFDLDGWHGIRLAVGRWPLVDRNLQDEIAAWGERINADPYNPISPIGAQSGGVVDTTREAYNPVRQDTGD